MGVGPPMNVFVDTSGLLAVLGASDQLHVRAARAWSELLAADDLRLITTSYVLVETCALVQSRLGIDALQAVETSVSPILDVIWVDSSLHRAATQSVLAARRRHPSLVDSFSFIVMWQRCI